MCNYSIPDKGPVETPVYYRRGYCKGTLLSLIWVKGSKVTSDGGLCCNVYFMNLLRIKFVIPRLCKYSVF